MVDEKPDVLRSGNIMRLRVMNYPYSAEKIYLRCKQACLPNKMLECRNSAPGFGFFNLRGQVAFAMSRSISGGIKLVHLV